MPTVINRHHFKNGLPEPSIYIGRGTPLGNPYTKGDFGNDALEMYRRWRWRRLTERDPAVLRALAEIREEHHLVCSCKPGPCHGDIVVRAWEWIRKQPPTPTEETCPPRTSPNK